MTKPTVLIAEDAIDISNLIAILLETMGCEVVGTVDNGDDAFTEHSRLNPDLTLLDIDMPGSDGISALHRIMQATPDAYVVMLTAHGETVVAEACLAKGARDFVTKVSSDGNLHEKLRSIVDGLG